MIKATALSQPGGQRYARIDWGSGLISKDRGRAFGWVASTTLCPYAKKANIIYGSPWDRAVAFDANLGRNALELKKFCEVSRDLELHGFVIEALVGEKARSMQGTKEVMHSIMYGLAAVDESANLSLASQDIETVDWQFTFYHTRLFTSVFAPCYPPCHTKHLRAADFVVVFFQPEFSFDFCNINRNNRSVRESIRHRFEQDDRPYDGQLIDRRIEAEIYMSPMEIGDQPVRWWLPRMQEAHTQY